MPVTTARYYHVARLAHLERLRPADESDFLYCEHRDDWDQDLANSISQVQRMGFAGILKRIWKSDYRTIEVPEPLAVVLLPRLVVVAAVVGLKSVIRRKSTTLAFYAIENLDQAGKASDRFGVPRWMTRPAIALSLRFVFRQVSRIAFGTGGASDNYKQALGSAWTRATRSIAIESFEALPSPAIDRGETGAKIPLQACFVGSFDERKGVRELMAAWPLVARALPAARLKILGHGPFEREVAEFADGVASAELTVDPPRGEIWKVYADSHCLILPSQRTPTWREQVGLPIVEALSYGCEIVTTDETGIADWLVTNGHSAIPPLSSPQHLADTIVAALLNSRSSAEILESLPARDSRDAADEWMFQS